MRQRRHERRGALRCGPSECSLAARALRPPAARRVLRGARVCRRCCCTLVHRRAFRLQVASAGSGAVVAPAASLQRLLNAWRRSQLGEWVVEVASQAGVAAEDARILASQLGAPESRLELELRFGSLADLEQFFNTLPMADHAAWGARLAPVVCDGSPKWHTLRVVDVASTPPSAAKAAATQPPPTALPATLRRSAGGLYLVGEAAPEPPAQELDWKGEPLTWSAGDRFPRVTD